MNYFDLIISILTFLLQFVVIVLGWRLINVAKFLDTWKFGWIHFTFASISALLLRVVWAGEAFSQKVAPVYIQSILGLIVSLCFLWFVYFMSRSFKEISENSVSSRVAAAELMEEARVKADTLKLEAEKKAEEVKLLAEKVARNLIMNALELKLDKLNDRVVTLEIKIKDK